MTAQNLYDHEAELGHVLARPAALTFTASALPLQVNLLAIAFRYARERRLTAR